MKRTCLERKKNLLKMHRCKCTHSRIFETRIIVSNQKIMMSWGVFKNALFYLNKKEKSKFNNIISTYYSTPRNNYTSMSFFSLFLIDYTIYLRQSMINGAEPTETNRL